MKTSPVLQPETAADGKPSAFRQPRLLITAAVVSLSVAAAAALYLRAAPAESNSAAPAPQAMPVPVATVVQREVVLWDEFSGRLEAVERVSVRPRVAGAIQSVHFTEGGLVARGDLLITIDPAPYAAEVDRAQAQVAAAEARLTYARSDHERARRLWDESAIARRELDERVNALREAEAHLRAAQAGLQSARLNLGYTQVRAPVAGRVGKLEVTAGNLVAAGAQAPVLTTLVSVDPIYASFDADEQIVARALKELHGRARSQLAAVPVELDTAGGERTLRGRLQLIDNQVNAQSGTVRVRAVFGNKDGTLTPGQFVTLRMGRPAPQSVLLVNERAVGTDQNKKFVMLVGADNKAAYREVTLGGTAEGLRIVTSGLAPEDRIVVNGLQRVRPGALLAPASAPMDSAGRAPGDHVHARS